ncbi:hypothetical protein C1H46_025099 [Malus baccata]|uniref:Uncharacterized protein n=1 Tax=Malus baccata TaxID=106549 RepID=A0A540LSR7_MALBA|nr:hypothetical protein C1H46_025099 [Malus baccata]
MILIQVELTNMDLKSISSRSLPDPHTLRKSSHLLGPKVLQVLTPLRNFSREFSGLWLMKIKRRYDAWMMLMLVLKEGSNSVFTLYRTIGPAMPSAELLAAAAKLTKAQAELREAELEEDSEYFIGPPPPAVVAETESANEAERFEEVWLSYLADT